MTNELEARTVKTVFVRTMPLLLVGYVLAYIDRVNVGFAALTMNKDLGISTYQYGLGAGLFYLSYSIFELPSNLLLIRFGPRRWFARIMITWGVLSMAVALATGPVSFVVLRLLLGFAEAGFFPGVILYLSWWFTREWRARMTAAFVVGIPVSIAIGSPISTALLQLDGVLGLRGWQWLYISEGAPTILLGMLILRVLSDGPRDARWLSDQQKDRLQRAIRNESEAIRAKNKISMRRMFTDFRVLLLCFISFGNYAMNLGITFFMPQMITDLGNSTVQTGLINAIPYVAGAFGTLFLGWITDKFDEPRITLFAALLISGLGLLTAAHATTTLSLIVFISVAAIGIHSSKVPLWRLPSTFLTGSAVAAGIGFISTIGNVGSFAGPYIMGWARDVTGNYRAGIYTLAAFGITSALASLLLQTPAVSSLQATSEANAAI